MSRRLGSKPRLSHKHTLHLPKSGVPPGAFQRKQRGRTLARLEPLHNLSLLAGFHFRLLKPPCNFNLQWFLGSRKVRNQKEPSRLLQEVKPGKPKEPHAPRALPRAGCAHGDDCGIVASQGWPFQFAEKRRIYVYVSMMHLYVYMQDIWHPRGPPANA